MRHVASTQDGWKYRDLLIFATFSPSSLFYLRLLRYMGFGGPVIKGLILVILQNYFGDLGEVCGKYPGWVKVPGPFDICHFFTQLSIIFTYIETYGFWGSRCKRRSNFSYLNCYTPKLFWRPRWGMWQALRMGESTRTFWYLPLFHPAHYSTYVYWDIWVLGVPL